jgi:hypothetical protein
VRVLAGTARAAVAAILLIHSVASAGADESPLSGQRLLQLCAGVEAGKPAQGTPADTHCLGYFQGVVDAPESVKALGAVTCPPSTLTVQEIVMFYKSEARIFPDALDARASDLITGMLIKFFPCPGDRGRGARR